MALNIVFTLNIAKLIYSWFIQQDAQMVIVDHRAKDISKCVVRNLNLIEELGEVDYLFCDKTGTLTQNILQFKAVSFPDKDVVIKIKEINAKMDFFDLQIFFKCINLCHENVSLANKVTGRIEYSGPSTDEMCFLDMAMNVKEFGYFKERDSNHVYI